MVHIELVGYLLQGNDIIDEIYVDNDLKQNRGKDGNKTVFSPKGFDRFLDNIVYGLWFCSVSGVTDEQIRNYKNETERICCQGMNWANRRNIKIWLVK